MLSAVHAAMLAAELTYPKIKLIIIDYQYSRALVDLNRVSVWLFACV